LTIRRGMSGNHVTRIQQRLQQLSIYRGPIDSDFGGGTEAAVKIFQRDHQLPVTGSVDAATWMQLFNNEQPPASEFASASNVDRCLALTGSFETGTLPPECYSGVTGDFDGQGISFGVLQWNLGQGSLQPLLTEMFEQHENVCGDIFHEHLGTLRSLGAASRTEQLEFSRSIQTRGQLHEPWRGILKTLGRTPEFQKIQARHASGLFKSATKLCAEYGLTSQRGLALMFDILAQNGSISALVKSQILADYTHIPQVSPPDVEVARMRVIANRRAAAARPAFVDDVRMRKLVIAEGNGVVHGIFYDLADQFSLTLDGFA
jgi:peptidoglycan hydrolase-like protein with peptidoglycan-binding domain